MQKLRKSWRQYWQVNYWQCWRRQFSTVFL